MDLKLLQWNAQNIKSHLAYFMKYMSSLTNTPDIICIQETHLKPKHNFSLPGYVPVRKDRTFAEKGGLLTLVKSSISYSDLDCPDGVESVGI